MSTTEFQCRQRSSFDHRSALLIEAAVAEDTNRDVDEGTHRRVREIDRKLPECMRQMGWSQQQWAGHLDSIGLRGNKHEHPMREHPFTGSHSSFTVLLSVSAGYSAAGLSNRRYANADDVREFLFLEYQRDRFDCPAYITKDWEHFNELLGGAVEPEGARKEVWGERGARDLAKIKLDPSRYHETPTGYVLRDVPKSLADKGWSQSDWENYLSKLDIHTDRHRAKADIAPEMKWSDNLHVLIEGVFNDREEREFFQALYGSGDYSPSSINHILTVGGSRQNANDVDHLRTRAEGQNRRMHADPERYSRTPHGYISRRVPKAWADKGYSQTAWENLLREKGLWSEIPDAGRGARDAASKRILDPRLDPELGIHRIFYSRPPGGTDPKLDIGVPDGRVGYWGLVDIMRFITVAMQNLARYMAGVTKNNTDVAEDAGRYAVWLSRLSADLKNATDSLDASKMDSKITDFLDKHKIRLEGQNSLPTQWKKADLEAYRDLLQNFANRIKTTNEQHITRLNEITGMASSLQDMLARYVKIGTDMYASAARNL
ncbi:hypothetical protein PTE30175_04260 [Pandoraea terrae]|uniref:Uncharacterized protein n=1 Tax=Pandoraea terrae TaxID=1537710 RepID=A0A5E4Y8P6_9BURK|nr:hypothetical protein [Pandoraea terrae]VVE45024.1 hypothetical protein PTE30175_04260 [Pandoraea terrae]